MEREIGRRKETVGRWGGERWVDGRRIVGRWYGETDRQTDTQTSRQTETERGWCRELRKLGQQQNTPHGLAEPPRPMELSGPVILVAVNRDEAEGWTGASW